jgi:hypothetical protein
VTATCLLPVEVNVHENVALPEPGTLVGDTMQEVLFVARLMTPAKPLIAVTVIVEVPAALTFTLKVEGLAVTVKSWTVYATVADAEFPLL